MKIAFAGPADKKTYNLDMLEDDGEIAPLDADRLDDYKTTPAEEEVAALSSDERAIEEIARKLKSKRPNLDSGAVFEMAENIYIKTWELLESGKATREQIQKAADLFGESLEDLEKRI